MLRLICSILLYASLTTVCFAEKDSVIVGSNCPIGNYKAFYIPPAPKTIAEAGSYFSKRLSLEDLKALRSDGFESKGGYRTSHAIECIAEFIDREWSRSRFAKRVKEDLEKNNLEDMPWASNAILYAAHDPNSSQDWIDWLRAIRYRDGVDESLSLPPPPQCGKSNVAPKQATLILDGDLGWQSMRTLYFCKSDEENVFYVLAWERGWFEAPPEIANQIISSGRTK